MMWRGSERLVRQERASTRHRPYRSLTMATCVPKGDATFNYHGSRPRQPTFKTGISTNFDFFLPPQRSAIKPKLGAIRIPNQGLILSGIGLSVGLTPARLV